MADKAKNKGRKIGRSKRNGQAVRYRNESRDKRNKLRRLTKYVKQRGFTGRDVAAAMHRCQDALGIIRSDTPFGDSVKTPAYDYAQSQ